MNIAVIGLGLIGGSMAKTIKKFMPQHTILGIDTYPQVMFKAKLLEAIDADVDAQIAEMLKFSLESPLPELSYATTHVYEDFAVENLEVAK